MAISNLCSLCRLDLCVWLDLLAENEGSFEGEELLVIFVDASVDDAAAAAADAAAVAAVDAAAVKDVEVVICFELSLTILELDEGRERAAVVTSVEGTSSPEFKDKRITPLQNA